MQLGRLPNCSIFYFVSDINKRPRHMRFEGLAKTGRAPYRSQFFHFDIQIFRNVSVSGLGAPLRGWHLLPWEILDPPLRCDSKGKIKIQYQ